MAILWHVGKAIKIALLVRATKLDPAAFSARHTVGDLPSTPEKQ